MSKETFLCPTCNIVRGIDKSSTVGCERCGCYPCDECIAWHRGPEKWYCKECVPIQSERVKEDCFDGFMVTVVLRVHKDKVTRILLAFNDGWSNACAVVLTNQDYVVDIRSIINDNFCDDMLISFDHESMEFSTTFSDLAEKGSDRNKASFIKCFLWGVAHLRFRSCVIQEYEELADHIDCLLNKLAQIDCPSKVDMIDFEGQI